VTKPFSVRELLARVRAILRRSEPVAAESGVVRHGDLELDLEGYRVTVGGREVSLTPTEFRLLALLATAPGKVFTRQELLEHLWGSSAAGELRTVDVHVRHLREKLRDDPAAPRFVETVRGVGYRFRAPPGPGRGRPPAR